MQRLQSRAQFQAVLNSLTVARTAHFALHRLPLDADNPAPGALFHPVGPWLGAMVPKRWARRAVTRNAIKRQIYAVSQTRADQLGIAAHVVRLRAGFDRQHFLSASSDVLKQAVRAELHALLARGLNT